ncbi:hypothetical protein KIN20_004311 [Parelaphostrongylus tenuis]|uniref:H15 domain-containing protein n=1 Tax=Parelaphostrongylus tenuis TaxID=148309 RepID=A0AAD5MJR6_PARTN|nr:hypothetical protein KIN20_004311 [Parelaphostrongylus tenuis]
MSATAASAAVAMGAATGTGSAKVGKGSKSSAVKKAPSHPTYSAMINKAVAELKDRSGSSKAAILKYLMAHYKLGGNTNKINSQLRMALKKAVAKGELKQVKGSGASGSFKLGEKKSAPSTKEKHSSKKPAAKEHKSSGKAASKEPKVEKKAKSPKRAKAPKAKTAKKRLAGKTTKPKKVKKPKISSSKVKKEEPWIC